MNIENIKEAVFYQNILVKLEKVKEELKKLLEKPEEEYDWGNQHKSFMYGFNISEYSEGSSNLSLTGCGISREILEEVLTCVQGRISELQEKIEKL